jgi:tetratricopeptide (TPR) repeat protein
VTDLSIKAPGDPRRFKVALSFPGEHRALVKEVADRLADIFGKKEVLYDKYHEAEFARLDLDIYLPNLYLTQSELIVLFLCPQYKAKRWCNLEWRFIKNLIATVDASRIMLLRYGYEDDFAELGILPGDGTVEFKSRPASEIAELIKQRFHINAGSATLPVSASAIIPVDISRIDRYAPAELIGRTEETKLLNDAWARAQTGEVARPHVLTFVGLGGEGKTSLVSCWTGELAYRGWPGCEAVFAWSFYSQGTREQWAGSSDLFLREALVFFGDPKMAVSAQGAFEKGRHLARIVGEKRALLILDGLEPLQYPSSSPMAGHIKDVGLVALVKGLASNNRGLCVITTRDKFIDLRAYSQTTASEVMLQRLSSEAGEELLRKLGVKGATDEFKTLVEKVEGHALTLTLLGSFLRRAHKGDIRQYAQLDFEKANEKIMGGHAFRTINAYEEWLLSGGDEGARQVVILRLMGLFDRPADAGCLYALRSQTISDLTEPIVGLPDDEWEFSLTGLAEMRLLTVNRDAAGALLSLDAHPLLREYFATTLSKHHLAAWRSAHRRLFEHLCTTTKDKPQPRLEDLQPLYQAVAHGCHAGMFEEARLVYRDRISRGMEGYSTFNLGAIGSDLSAIACFFEKPWNHVARELSETGKAWLLNEAAFTLRALGRLTESLEPLKSSLDLALELKRWDNAARANANLSEVEVLLGDLGSAIADGKRSVTLAERAVEINQDIFTVIVSMSVHADAVHQTGRREQAQSLFRKAASTASLRQMDTLLRSVAGFSYCEFLVAAVERAAWRRTFQPSYNPPASVLILCDEVSQRAEQMLHISGRDRPLDLGICSLSKARSQLYAALLSESERQLMPCSASLKDAVNDLRRAGVQEHLPRGLLTGAWLHCLLAKYTGLDSAQQDLDEAWEIAERGPMPLLRADIHLHRARLFGLSKDRPAKYPWASPQYDLAEARRLIEKHGYWRRREELEDAEAALDH